MVLKAYVGSMLGVSLGREWSWGFVFDAKDQTLVSYV